MPSWMMWGSFSWLVAWIASGLFFLVSIIVMKLDKDDTLVRRMVAYVLCVIGAPAWLLLGLFFTLFGRLKKEYSMFIFVDLFLATVAGFSSPVFFKFLS